MTAALIIKACQILSALGWGSLLAVLSPPIWRATRGRGSLFDRIRTPLWLAALSMVLFVARWLIWPGAITVMGTDELSAWGVTYALSACSAFGLIQTNRILQRILEPLE